MHGDSHAHTHSDTYTHTLSVGRRGSNRSPAANALARDRWALGGFRVLPPPPSGRPATQPVLAAMS
eukprot:3317485-Lingulodinium_polyedra.AAC.1